MFHFKRRTLWIIIYVTIPLIIILNNLGPEPETSLEQVTQWSLDEVQPQCQKSLCRLDLPGARDIRLSAILNAVPVTQVPVPDELAVNVRQQGGTLLVTMTIVDPLHWSLLLDFASQWLPAEPVSLLVSGAVDASIEAALTGQIGKWQGQSVPLAIEPPRALAVLQSPAFGSNDQLAFLIWIEILKQRLSGYQIEVNWDHRQVLSHVLINSSLSLDLFSEVTASELAPVLQAYQQAAAQRIRSAEQLHRYASSALIYGVPFDYFVQQPERLAALTLNHINQMREFALGQIHSAQ